MLLHIAALEADRKAGWLLASYYRLGRFGFPQDPAAAARWRDRTERRLRSDAYANYSHPQDKREALQLYRQWRRWCRLKWRDLDLDTLQQDGIGWGAAPPPLKRRR
jgi:hypothetical protein